METNELILSRHNRLYLSVLSIAYNSKPYAVPANSRNERKATVIQNSNLAHFLPTFRTTTQAGFSFMRLYKTLFCNGKGAFVI